jgi:hypothetical protein
MNFDDLKITRSERSRTVLTREELDALVIVARSILAVDRAHEKYRDYDAATRMLNDLWSCGLTHDEFDRFSQIINDAADSDFRCPK